jgi:glycosyltransferase involved in cell wall biosynthesis
MPKITVIISAYKDRGWLDQAILSAKNQTFGNYEIILSSDGNWNLRRYAEYHEIGFCCSDKYNHSMALNNAVEMASGEWIKECHDDDYLTPNCLTDLYNSRGGALVYANAYNLRDGRESLFISDPNVTLEKLLPLFVGQLHAATFMFRKDAFQSVGGFDINVDCSEEYEFYINLLKHGCTFTYCPTVVSYYRLHHDQLTTIYDAKWRERIKKYITEKHKL